MEQFLYQLLDYVKEREKELSKTKSLEDRRAANELYNVASRIETYFGMRKFDGDPIETRKPEDALVKELGSAIVSLIADHVSQIFRYGDAVTRKEDVAHIVGLARLLQEKKSKGKSAPDSELDERDFETEFAAYLGKAGITIQQDETLSVYGFPFNSTNLVNVARSFARWAEERLLAGASQSRIEELRHGINTSVIKAYIPGAEVGDEVYIIPKKKRLAVVTPEDLLPGKNMKIEEGAL